MAMDKDKQMEMLFEEGGIADDGMSVDPVSGNQVPSGSMASEVRDDVPAQLSEGEYVVPADVTRYYGVKFFEDLRTQAKMGLGEMEQDGRIGGEPVAVEEGVLTPEEEEVLNMAMGGFVGKQGYNEGGSVSRNVAPQFTMANYLFGGAGLGSFGTGTGNAGSEGGTAEDRAVILYGPNGATVSLVLPAQQAEYEAYIEQGYSETQNVTTQQSVNLAGGDGDGGGNYRSNLGTPDSPSSTVSGFSDAPSYGTGLGTLGTTIAGGALGLGLGGLGGMLKGAESSREAAEFNNARNDLVSAIQSNDMEAISKAEADIRSTFGELNKATRAVGVYDEGKTAEEAINNVRQAVYMSRTTTGVDSDGNVPSYEAIPGSTSSAIGGGYQGPNLGTGTAGYNVVDPTGGGSNDSGDNNGSTSSDTSNVGNWGGDRDGDGVPNAVDFDDGVGWADTNKDDTGSSGGGGGGGGYGCYVATALSNSGYWSDTKRLKLIKQCMETKPEGSYLTKVWRNGYVTFGKGVIAPLSDKELIKWFADGYYDSAVGGKKTFKALIGLAFFALPSYSIGIFKALTGKLVDIERT